jgi:acetyl-CoA carboxylase biotin carboxyl carrier protein
MESKEIQEIIKFVSRLELAEVKIEQGDFKLTIKRTNGVVYSAPMSAAQPMYQPVAQPAAAPSVAPEVPKADAKEPASDLITFRAPIIGTFYRQGKPGNPPFAEVGQTVKKGQVVCIIEAMKLFNEIECDIEGKIVKILVDNAQPVEYDQPLFLIDPKG